MSDLAKRIANLSPAQLEALSKRLKKSDAAERPQPIPRRDTSADPPALSFAQQRMWFLDQLEPGNPSYNIPAAVSLKGALDVDALRRTLDEVVARHESLRTTFPSIDGRPVQFISPPTARPLQIIDLGGLPEGRREAEARRLADEEARRPFELARGPLFRAALLRLAEDEHVALLTMHHIVSDGWSMDVFVREVAALYRAFAAGRPSPLPDPPIQYADFAVWQSARMSAEVLEGHLSYWRRQLANAPAALELPTDRPRPAGASHEGARHDFTFPPALSQRLKALCRGEGVTPFTLLLAAFKTLLYRYTGQDDIVVGSPVANRNSTETEQVIGLFVNTLALRTDLSGDPSFRELLRREREVVLGAYAHQELPFEKVVEEVQPERSLSHAPVFQVEFFLENAQPGVLELPGLEMRPLSVESGAAKFDLTLAMEESGPALGGKFIYNSAVFAEPIIAGLARHFESLLEGVAADPEQRLTELPLLTEDEERGLARAWQDAPTGDAPGGCVHEEFARQAAGTPEQAAVVYEDERVSYDELEARANRLARYLRRVGVGPETRVCLLLERSAEMVAAALGVLKAGGAYVPLDPRQPGERLAFMARDSGAAVLVTHRGLADRLDVPCARVVSLDAEAGQIARESAEGFDGGAHADNLAYVIYTSGSTGRPKGVMVTHRSALNLLRALSASVYAGQPLGGLRASLNAPFSFDASVQQLLLLLRGATLHVIGHETKADAEELVRYLRRHRIEAFDCTPSHLRSLLRAGLLSGDGHVPRKFLVAGEAVDAALWRELSQEGGGAARAEFYNIYGPTECTVDATACRITAERARPVIGRPLAGYEVYVLDERQRPLPAWVTGEIYVGGLGVARGYLNRAGLTAERFVPHPSGPAPGARLYRTGDLGRRLPDGTIEYMGRTDEQVKVRGYRIEPGEVEAALRLCPGVREAVVVARAGADGDKRLIGYVVGGGDGDGGPSAAGMRAFMKQHVPEYMIPAAFVNLESLPLTASGKVDKRALPAPEAAGPTPYTPPRTPTEEIVAGVWAQVLGVERVGAEDDFFELGGHSLLATQVVSRLREAFGIALPLKTLFEAPDVAGLAARIDEEQSAGRGLAPMPIERLPRGGPLQLSFAQERLWFLDQLKPGDTAYNLPQALRLTGRLDVAAFERTLNEVVSRHEVLRTSFAVEGERPVQVIAPELRVRLEVQDLSGVAEHEREAAAKRLARAEALRPFDLQRGPLFRASLLRLREEEHLVLFTLHHIVSDGWSMTVLIKEVAALYAAFAKGEPSPLAELPVQYADYAAWQRRWLQGEVLEKQLSYWREQLRGAATLELPTDRVRPAVQTTHGAHHAFSLSPELSEGLKELSRAEGATLFMTLLAAFEVLLARYSGQRDVSVGTPVAGRNRVEVEGLVGFFVNMLVVRADLSGRPSFREAVGRVREACLGAYAHQDVPFERLVEELSPGRDLSRSPLFQVVFLLENELRETLELPGLKLSSVANDSGPASYDLGLSMSDVGSQLVGEISYNTDLFDAATIKRMEGHFRTLLWAAVADPRRDIAELPLLTQSERHELLTVWNNTAVAYPGEALLHGLFEEQAGRTPDTVAVVYEGERVSYRELDARANRLAHHLRALGVGPDVPVGVLMERSVEMVVALLGVLKAGGAYVPLEPTHPRERLAFMIEDAGVRVLLTQARLVAGLPESTARVVRLDADWPAIAAESEQPPRVGVTADNLAYVIYTSGSTGRPKGVMVAHGGIRNRLLWMQAAYGLGAGDAVAQKTPFGFDVSVWEFFWPLLAGARLVVARPGGHREAAYLARLIEAEGVTVVHFVPSMLQVFLDEPEAARCRGVKKVICSGEALSFNLQERFFAASAAELHNLYGPTEASVDVTHWACERGGRRQVVPIGRPIANTETYILSGEGQPVPAGVTGELLLGGVGLARGYLNRPALTAEKFIPHPFAAEPGARLYRTGDLARYLPGGEIEYLGRLDHQVKIRGFRIELGEIEAALSRHDAVRETVVVAAPEAGGGQRLVAYVVAAAGQSPKVGELREHLLEALPEYMVPSSFVFLDGMPLTANGKVDRRALPPPEQSRPDDEVTYVAPRTPLEAEVAAMWGELLGFEEIGIYDNFFELGGHSLLLTQLASRFRSAFGVDIPLRVLFGAPTVVQMTVAISVGQLELEDTSDIADMLEELKHLSPDEVQSMLDASEG